MFNRRYAGIAIAIATTISGTTYAQVAPAAPFEASPAAELSQVRSRSEAEMLARRRVETMEAILERAVSFGADQIIVQVRDIMGGDQPRLNGAPRVRGFRLPGYGMVFDVDVPSLQVPILWPVRYLVDDARAASAILAELRTFARQMEDAAYRAELQRLIAKLELQATPTPNIDRLRQNVAGAAVAPEAPRPETPPPPTIDDPQAEYRKQVKAALIDAILENPASVQVGPEEWLALAAGSNIARDPLYPGDTVSSTTWVARIRGSVLADLRAQRITVAQARDLVEQGEQ